MKKILIFLMGCLVLTGGSAVAQSYVPSPENLQARKEFQQHRLGIFLHWGLYATYAQGEWYLQTAGLNKDEYAVAAQYFNPVKYDARAWTRAFKDAGAGYVTLTSRHHDGFSMFNTAATDYDIIDATPFGRDIVGELAKACAEEGLDYHLYYSLVDWVREDYPLGETGHKTGRRGDSQDYGHYFQFMKDQVRELITQYPNVAALWFDGIWDHDSDPGFDWRMPEFYAYIHGQKPELLIGNNHHKAPIEGEDFQMFERDLPGENKAGMSGESTISSLPLEMCETMNNAWGYRIADPWYKSVKELVHLLVRAAAKNSNLLINIGPMANGELPSQALDRLAGIGVWMRGHSVAVDGTTSTAIPEQPWGVTTQNATSLFLHILTPDALPVRDGVSKVIVPLPSDKTPARKGAVSLLSGEPLSYDFSKDGFLTVTLPQTQLEDIDTVIKIRLQ
jgi:alpha-L-fucosidase